MTFCHEEDVDLRFVYGDCSGNASSAVEEHRRRCPPRQLPHGLVFTRVYRYLRGSGSFSSVNSHA